MEIIERIIEKQKKLDKPIFIFCHKDPDGDAIGSRRALTIYLENSGAKVTTNAKNIDVSGIAVVVDTSSVDFVNSKKITKFKPENIFVFDHHIRSKTGNYIETELKLPKENVYVDGTQSSNCEVLLHVFDKSKITERIANALLKGLLYDTAVLKYIKKDTLKNVKMLLECGANFNKYAESLSDEKRFPKEEIVKIFFKNTEKIKFNNYFGLFYVANYEKTKIFEENYGLKPLNKYIFLLNNIYDCAFACLIIEREKNKVDVSLRSNPFCCDLDVQSVAVKFGGGGHKNAAGCQINLNKKNNLLQIKNNILSEINKLKINKIIKINNNKNNNKLKLILDETNYLTRDVNIEKIEKIENLIKNGANFDFLIKKFKNFNKIKNNDN